MNLRSLIANHMIKKIAFSLGIFALAISTAGASLLIKTAHAVTNPLIISAVQTTGGEGKTGEDFVEIYNPNSEPFNLNGYRLVKRSGAGTADSAIKSWSSDTMIPAYSFYLWANSGFTTISSTPDTVTSSTLADNNGVAIRFGANDTGTLVDSLSWGTTTNGFTSSGIANPIAGQSIVRNSLFENLGYGLSGSQPRNSSKQVLPVSAPEPVPVPQLVDDSTCKIIDTNSSDESVQISSVTFTNTGNTSWVSPSYIVDGLNSEDIALNSSQSVAPGGVLNSDLQFPVPLSGGKQVYEWQMSNGGVKFGQKCSLELNFQDIAQTTPTEELPAPETSGSGDPQPTEGVPEQPQPEPIPEETPSTEPTVPEVTESNDQSVKITELLINPEGKDDGQEKVELYNDSDIKINLTDWVFDDIKDGAAVTSDKYVLPSLEINPKSYLVVTLPAGKAVLNNSKGDVISIINSEGEFIDTVEYEAESSPENKTLSLIDAEWAWTAPSLGVVNVAPVDNTKPEETPDNVEVNDLEITEVYAAPSKGQVEFLELFNSGDKKINLSNVTLKIGDKLKALPDVDLLPGKYLALKDKQLPLALLDKGAEIQLLEQDGSKISNVTYEKSAKGLSYSLIDGKFVWTASATPGEANKFTEIPASTKEKTVVTKKVTTTTKTTPTKTVAKKTVVKKTTTSPAKSNVNNVLPKNNNLISTQNSAGIEQSDLANKGSKNNVNIIAMVLASLGAGSFAIYKFGFGGF